jgi:hypothetical protein
MPSAPLTLAVHGTASRGPYGLSLVLSQKLDGHDTFLTGRIDLEETSITVRILTLDDVTVLRPTTDTTGLTLGRRWHGTLHLPHGLRRRTTPTDLEHAAARQNRSLEALDEAESRYALTFLSEATTPAIRRARIDAIVSALPTNRSPK